jgi:mRNA interferase MazF
MQKDFDNWNEKKKCIDNKDNTPFFKEGEVWWVYVGLNVGFEINGKGSEFTRPVLIIKKYNQFSFLALPLTTSSKISKYLISVGIIACKNAVANVSQLKNIDSKRLVRKVCSLEKGIFNEVKIKTSQINFG